MKRIFSSFLPAAALLLTISAPVFAQTAGELQAARQETYIDTLQLYPAAGLKERGIYLAYVNQDTAPGNGRYHCGALNGQQMQKAAAITASTIETLPAAAWDNIDLKYILLCSDTYAGGQKIGGIPVPPLKLLMLATGETPEQNRFSYTLLHELYHLVEMQKNSHHDSAWNQKFTGYRGAYDAGASKTDLGSGGRGFINGYGQSFAHEERAELFAIHLLSGADLRQFIARTQDGILQEKLDTLVRKCQSLLKASC